MNRMKKSAQREHQRRQQHRWNDFVAHIRAEQQAGNTQLAAAFEVFPSLGSYGWDWLEDFRLVALIPAQAPEHRYYAMRGYGAGFLADQTAKPVDKRFVFGSEFQYLLGADSRAKAAYHAYLESHPVVVFFRGGDDGHVGMRFATEHDARQFLSIFQSFDEVFDFDINPKGVLRNLEGEPDLDALYDAFSMSLCYHN